MTALATIYLAGRDWLMPALIGGGVALLLVAVSYARTEASHGLRVTCAVLKIIGIAALLACLLEPMWSEQRAKPGANLLAVVADNSRSMGIRDKGADGSRGERLARKLTGTDNKWRTTLSAGYEVRNYLADARVLPTQDFREMKFDGDATLPVKSLTSLAERHRGQPLAGIVLLTDGVVPDVGDAAQLAGMPPVYPVVFAGDGPERDLAIGATTVTQTSFEDAPVTIEAEVIAHGFSGGEVVAKLHAMQSTAGVAVAADAPPLATQTLVIPKESGRATARMQLRPAQTGVIFYRLTIEPRDSADEATRVNNETVVVVNRGSAQQRVLYVGGRPNWEFKFLNRAVQADEQTQLVGLVRIAKREPKFEFRGRAGEASNPLFRGFGKQDEVERYDQPVLVRLNTEDEHELRGGFPKTPEDLFRYRAIVLDDLEAEFFTAEQQSLVQRFVSERGGGLLMLGGAESFAGGKWARTAIGDVLPVYVQGSGVRSQESAKQWKLSLTREGWLQPWARLRASEGDEMKRLESVPQFDVVNSAGTPKPAATVVAHVSDGSREVPALVTQRFGRGRASALLIGDFFQSGLGDEERQKDLGRAWRQLVRWLIADVPDAIEARVEQQGDAVKLLVQARDKKFQPLENATVTLAIAPTAPNAKAVLLPAEPSAGEPGVYEATFFPRESGGYRVEATVQSVEGKVAGTAQTGWTTDLPAAEFRDLRANRAALEQLAKATGGRVVAPDELDEFARKLPGEKAPVTETWTQPLWHTPWMLLAALACFLVEWGIRRRKGLA